MKKSTVENLSEKKIHVKNWGKTLTTNKIFSYFPSRVFEGCSSAHLAWVYLGYLPHPSTDMTGMPALHIVSCNWYMEAKITQCIWVEILKMCIVACCSGQTSETVVGRVEIPETMSNKQQKPGRHFYFEIWFHKPTTLLELWANNSHKIWFVLAISQITSQSFYSASPFTNSGTMSNTRVCALTSSQPKVKEIKG